MICVAILKHVKQAEQINYIHIVRNIVCTVWRKTLTMEKSDEFEE